MGVPAPTCVNLRFCSSLNIGSGLSFRFVEGELSRGILRDYLRSILTIRQTPTRGKDRMATNLRASYRSREQMSSSVRKPTLPQTKRGVPRSADIEQSFHEGPQRL